MTVTFCCFVLLFVLSCSIINGWYYRLSILQYLIFFHWIALLLLIWQKFKLQFGMSGIGTLFFRTEEEANLREEKERNIRLQLLLDQTRPLQLKNQPQKERVIIEASQNAQRNREIQQNYEKLNSKLQNSKCLNSMESLRKPPKQE